MSHTRFNENEPSDYENSDSDEDYTENEKILLNKVRNSRKTQQSDSEDEVFDVGGNEDSSNEDLSDIALSDVEGQEDKDDLPDVRAWGKNKRKYYSTDYVDGDYGGFQGKDAELAELEEEETRNFQQQLAQQLDDNDFTLDIPTQTKKAPLEDAESENVSEEIIKSDISKLTKRQKQQILHKESPEFPGIVQDFESKINLATEFLAPVIAKYKRGQITNGLPIEFISTHYELILNYIVNINMYLLLKSSRINIQNHPVVKRLYQYRQLLAQLDPVFESVMKSQIDLLLSENVDDETPTSSKKTLKILQKLQGDPEKVHQPKKINKTVAKSEKKVQFMDPVDETNPENQEFDEVEEKSETLDSSMEATKRGITYQIAKNKGLTPHRKKEQRNPRVKHRNKFRKAKIRRKGAVREVRTEVQRYQGELSGIKASVSKSVKFKS